jgi:hypothetical protein
MFTYFIRYVMAKHGFTLELMATFPGFTMAMAMSSASYLRFKAIA